ncbi:MAG: AAA family ATPase [Christensenellales bacterium]|jgi:predicted kinase
MNLPFLIIVTGEPGAGKTTFAEALSREACLPLLSRDRIKEGCVHTWEQSASQQPENANLLATNLFFEIMVQMLSGGCSLIAEAAFQHAVWEKYLSPLMDKAQIRICLCAPERSEIARERFLRRDLADMRRSRFHGTRGEAATPLAHYEPPQLQVLTFRIDTTGEYIPSLSALIPQLLNGYTEENRI